MNKDNIRENEYKAHSFDEYIRQGEPQKKERAEAWSVAIGLQAVDGLKVSDYLLELARRITGRFLDPLKMAESITDLRTSNIRIHGN